MPAAQRQLSHGDLINLAPGQPSTPAPAPVRAAAVAALGNGEVLGYTVATGVPELRAGIAAHYASRYELDGGCSVGRSSPRPGAITPGVDFDTVDGPRFVRLSFSGATADIVAALHRLRVWLG